MDLRLSGKRALVTGASKGIGKAIAISLAAEGCAVDIASRDKDTLDRVAVQIAVDVPSADICSHVADLSLSADQELLFEACRDVDILINNAGIAHIGNIEATARCTVVFADVGFNISTTAAIELPFYLCIGMLVYGC